MVYESSSEQRACTGTQLNMINAKSNISMAEMNMGYILLTTNTVQLSEAFTYRYINSASHVLL